MSGTTTMTVGTAITVASGKFMCEFSDLHKAMTDLAGWPVMTHHLANEALADGAAAKVIAQVPWMPGAIENMPTWSALPRDEVRPCDRAVAGSHHRRARRHGDHRRR